jgi:hypothetical protein
MGNIFYSLFDYCLETADEEYLNKDNEKYKIIKMNREEFETFKIKKNTHQIYKNVSIFEAKDRLDQLVKKYPKKYKELFIIRIIDENNI